MTKFCAECGSEDSAGGRFCVQCGADVFSEVSKNDSVSRPPISRTSLHTAAGPNEDVDQLRDEFPELLRMEGEASAWMPLLSFLAIPGWAFGAWEAWGYINWLSFLLSFGAVFFFYFGFYSLWKFHTYRSTARQTEILIRALRNPSISSGPQEGSAS